jgi:hypothetical protein
MHENPATLYTVHAVTNGEYTEDIEYEYNISSPTESNIREGLVTSRLKAGYIFMIRTNTSPTGIQRIAFKVSYIDNWSPSKGSSTQRYSRKYYTRRVYKIKRVPVSYKRNGKKVKYYRKKKVSRKIKYYKVYINGEPKTRNWQRLKSVSRKTVKDADHINSTYGETKIKNVNKSSVSREEFIARRR